MNHSYTQSKKDEFHNVKWKKQKTYTLFHLLKI